MEMESKENNSVSWLSNFLSSARRVKPLISPSSSEAHGSKTLVRHLNLFDLILIGVGASIGAGIFVVTGTVAREAGPGVTISFILAGLSCLLNALCYAELASRFPAVVGGAYLYAYTAFNELTAFLVFGHLMLDFHIGAANIARSLAGYVVRLLEPIFKEIPSWIGHGGKEYLGGAISLSLLAPILLALLTIILCQGVGKSAMINSIMTILKIIIVLVVIIVGSFKIDVSNWSPFAPTGARPILTGATVVFFAYVGFDAVANTAEESRKPQRDLPIGILVSLLVCAGLYVGVSLVITGMVPYKFLGEEAPLAEAFTSNGLKFVAILISVGAVAGLTTTLLVGLYVQSRLYLGLGRDGLLPAVFAKVHPKHRTPVRSQIWVGLVAGVLAGLFNVHILSRILSVGSLVGYSVVAASVVTLRWKDKTATGVPIKGISSWMEGVISLILLALCGFAAGLIFRLNASYFYVFAPLVIAVYEAPPGFSCPGVPIAPAICIIFNFFLFAQLHYEAWIRFAVFTVILVGVYAFYGQHHADPLGSTPII
ncbi:Cationic amino acid transporter, C-terminal [Dillenia turbinata]|uniref:Cationic amino acid transporter, C-terminal n=1 Tax=Dillenia turbinata TaxID=194707 RepID=A0AAN8Z072_9MAGN